MNTSQKIRSLAPEMDPLRLGMGWSLEDLEKPQIMVECTFGDSHPGSAHLLGLADAAMAASPKLGLGAPVTLPPISATAWPKGTTALTIL